jgi:choline dehydrogenase
MPDNSFNPAASARLEAAERALMQGRLDRRSFAKIAAAAGLSLTAIAQTLGFAKQARAQQDANAATLAAQYDYIVVGAGSAGCVVASRLTENPNMRVLLLEEGGWDTAPSVTNPGLWFTNIGTPRSYVYPFHASHCNNRIIPMAMGRGIGGGSMINASVWARGHKENYAHWASVSGDPGWSYDAVLDIYRRIEDWQGEASAWRGKGGNVYVKPLDGVNPIAPAMVKAASALGIPASPDLNGATMESQGGVGIAQALVKDGLRHG